jgi:hypothetical protein
MTISDLKPRVLEQKQNSKDYNGNERIKWKWIAHKLRKGKGLMKQDILDQNPKGSIRKGPRRTQKRPTEEDVLKKRKNLEERKKKIAGCRVC